MTNAYSIGSVNTFLRAKGVIIGYALSSASTLDGEFRLVLGNLNGSERVLAAFTLSVVAGASENQFGTITGLKIPLQVDDYLRMDLSTLDTGSAIVYVEIS